MPWGLGRESAGERNNEADQIQTVRTTPTSETHFLSTLQRRSQRVWGLARTSELDPRSRLFPGCLLGLLSTSCCRSCAGLHPRVPRLHRASVASASGSLQPDGEEETRAGFSNPRVLRVTWRAS